MRIAYFDCATGISGDMTLAALIDAGVDAEVVRSAIRSLELDGVQLVVESVVKHGFRATHVRVEHPPQHAHRHLSDIRRILEKGAISAAQRNLALKMFEAIARAEASVHGSTIDKIHFHEVGAIDSIVDIIGAAVAIDLLAADEIVSSPVPTGRGQIQIEHGICTVPAPGTAELLKGIPLVDVPVEAELTTPTGAAILATVVDRFAPLPAMTVEQIGYGAGTMDLPGRANVLRVFVGTAEAASEHDQVAVLETNLDDVSGEVIGYAKRLLLDKGALDVYSVPIQMKKDRPGVMVCVICRPADIDAMESILFQETGTFGIRRTIAERSKRLRQAVCVETPWGPVSGKMGWRLGEASVFTPEYEDCARIAEENRISLREVYRVALAAFTGTGSTPTVPPVEPASPARGKPQAHAHHHDHDHHGHDHDHHHQDHSHDHDHGHGHNHDIDR